MNTWIRTLITTWLLLAGTLASITVSTTVSANSSSDTYTLYYLTDMLGSPTVVTDGNGNTLWYEHNEPFGRTRKRRTADNSPFPADYTGDRQGYTGHLNDSGSGLVYMQARYYDPVIGRFYSNDPVGFVDDVPAYFNRYAYAANNPYRYIDPDGKSFTSYLGGLVSESWEALSGSGDGQFNGEHLLGALADGYNFDQGLNGFIGALAEDAMLVIDIATAGGSLAVTGSVRVANAATKNGAKIGDYAHNYQRNAGAVQRVPQVLQSGGNKLNNRTSKVLNEHFGEKLNKRDWGRALEGLKRDNGLRNDHHGRILDNGDYVNDAGEILGNISHYLP